MSIAPPASLIKAQDTLLFWDKLALQIDAEPSHREECREDEFIKRARKFRTWARLHAQDLTNIKVLRISCCALSSIPSAIGSLSNLQILDLSNNRIATLPARMGALSQLQMLEVSRNCLLSLPLSLRKCSELYWINLSENALTSFPRSVLHLKKLTTLNLAQNFLSFLPADITKLNCLETLDLKDNCLESVSSALADLGALRSLNLSGNRLPHLPLALAHLPRGCSLYVSDNPISSLHAEAFEHELFAYQEGPWLRDPLVTQHTPDRIDTLEKGLAFWQWLFLETFSKNAVHALPDTNELPQGEDLLVFYYPLLVDDRAPLLLEFLHMLAQTRDFKDVIAHDNCILKVMRFLVGAAVHSSFREQLFSCVEEACQECEDRIAWGLNEIEMHWCIHCEPRAREDDVAFARALIGFARSKLLELLALKRAYILCAPSQTPEVVEVQLFYQIEFRQRFGLPVTTSGMKHVGVLRNLSREMIEEDARMLYEQSCTVEQLTAFLLHAEPWCERVKERCAATCQAINSTLSQKIEALFDDPVLSEKDKLSAIDALYAEQRERTRGLVQEFTEAFVKTHIALFTSIH